MFVSSNFNFFLTSYFNICRNDNNDMPFDMPTQGTNTKTSIKSDSSQQTTSEVSSSTQKSNSKQIQSMEEMESKTMNLTETTSNASKNEPKKHILNTYEKQKLIGYVKEKFANEKFKDDKLGSIKHQIPTSSSMHMTGSQGNKQLLFMHLFKIISHKNKFHLFTSHIIVCKCVVKNFFFFEWMKKKVKRVIRKIIND